MTLNERGITLPEILIATVLIGLGLVGVLIVVPVAAVGIQDGSQTSLATFLAQQRLEQARHATWTASEDCLGLSDPDTAAPAPSGATCDGASATTFPDETPIDGFTQYTRITRIADVENGLRRVTVVVGYQPLTGTGVGATAKTVILEWLVARR